MSAAQQDGHASAVVHPVEHINVAPSARAWCSGVIAFVTVVVLVLTCLIWTVWMMLLTASPTATVNQLMSTGDLDFGAFWRLSESPKGVVVAGIVGLIGVVLGYVVVLWRILAGALKRRCVVTHRPTAKVSGLLPATDTSPSGPVASHLWPAGARRLANLLGSDSLDFVSESRRLMNSLIKLADLANQGVFLAQILGAGLPVALLAVFAAIVALHALCTAVMFAQPHDNMGRPQLLVDTSFDVANVLVFPALVLVYAIQSFTFDRALMTINAQVFPAGSFELVASAVADPIEVAMVRRTLDAVRVDSVLKLFTRVGASAALCHRFFGLAELLNAHHAGRVAFPNVYPTRQRALAALFCLVAIAVVVVTTGSVLTSSAACAMHPECVQIARRWVSRRDPNDPSQCPCLAMIDRNVAIATYDEWATPVDRTKKLAQLAASGHLQTLQLVNRALPIVPEELRRCKDLKHLALYYTETVAVPDWFAEFTKLEFFHVEGKSLFESLQQLPDGIFNNMKELAFLHLGVHGLRSLPSLDGLTSLKTLVLGGLVLLKELPSFEKLHGLERLTVSSTPRVEVFPDLTHVRGLQSLVVADRGAFCCNGFLGPDKCDLNRTLCQQGLYGIPAVTQCLSPRRVASPATRTYFDKFPLSACFGEAMRVGDIKLSPTPQEVAQCNGTMYRACRALDTQLGTPAMCYNTRWMPIACDPSPFAIEMRRRQIALGVGEPCDPKHEAWLGCNQT